MEATIEKTTLAPYPLYKTSGVEWLGEIPENWKSLSNKYIFKLNKIQVGKKSSEYDLLSLTLNGVIKRDMDNPSGKFPAEFDTYQEVKKGDFIFCLFDVEETPRTVGLSDFDGMITGAYTVMQVDNSFNKSFLYYFYLNLDANKRMKPLYTGLRNTISKDNFYSFKTFVPPIKEQTAIANFLDDKTTKIDQAIAIKQKQIELLKERRQILIHKAVTRGLNDNVKLKDSGVEWIGEIPEHWEVKRLKYVAGDFMYGTSVDCNELIFGTPVLRIPNIGELHIEFEKLKYVILTETETKKYLLKKNDILIVRTNGNPSLVGKSAIFDGIGDFMFASYLIRVRPKNNIEPNFLIQTMNSFSIRGSLTYSSRTTAGNYNLNTQSLGDCYLAYPPKNEQLEIVKDIDSITSKIAAAISLKEQEIEKLKEYKMSLIDGVVTGKVRVS
jgi:type I restriction enzyme S subunit